MTLRSNESSIRTRIKVSQELWTSRIADLFTALGIEASELNETTSQSIDTSIGSNANVAERWLEGVIRDRTYLHTATGWLFP